MYLLLKISEWFTGHFTEIAFRFMKWNVRFFSGKVKERIEGYQNLPEWKQTALEDFKFWLEDLPDTRPGTDGSEMDACDLYTLLSEFSALRKEIQLQSREQNKTLDTLTSFIDAYRESKALFEERSENLADLEERIRKGSEKRIVLSFLDVRDALVRGHKAAQDLAKAAADLAKVKGIFKSAPKGTDEVVDGINGIIEGYEIAIRRFDRSLAMTDIHLLPTAGQPFDPRTMKAAGKRSEPEAQKGIVLEELLSGFVRGEEVIRTAEVIVNV